MRVSSFQTVRNYQNQLNRAYEHKTKLMEQADGSKLHRPSDNASEYSKYTRFQVTYDENDQYQKNVDVGRSWMKTSDSAIVGMTDLLASLKERTIAAATDVNGDTDMDAIAKEMLAKIQEIVSLGNQQQGDRYVFSGQADLTQPLVMSETQVNRGVAKTLDDNQKKFFSGVPATGGDLSQMLTLKGDDGNEYYVNTATGDVYDYDFMTKGYKDMMTKYGTEAAARAAGETTRVGNIGAVGISTYFSSEGVHNGTALGQSVTVNGTTVNLSFSTVSQNIVRYNGDFKYISMTKKNGTIEPTADTVNLHAGDLYGTSLFDYPGSGNPQSGTAVINDMLTVHAKVDSSDVKWLTSDGVAVADNAHATVVTSQGKMAARHNVYNSVATMLDTQSAIVLGDITDVSSTDVAKLATQLMQAETLYNMSLSVGARILPPSLADYLS
ncbi:hypothetical protein TAMA11512_22360 [Selenomonas sp. TAMA-11512]|uniref:flagellin N-terminal helical domain-containing protein n=1 Tax=Selenomonas sp. TAMA-11512 TaxID=3095337 RepID=UPI00308C4081|nr:hypothetical protein TAMA11512_22360 [Selenomonas sp. TAMA-11512]